VSNYQIQYVDDPMPERPAILGRDYALSEDAAERKARETFARGEQPPGARGYRVIQIFTQRIARLGLGAAESQRVTQSSQPSP
jgi:hypothetical protein